MSTENTLSPEDDVRAAVESLQSAAPEPTPVPEAPEPVATDAAKATDTAAAEARARDEKGRFAEKKAQAAKPVEKNGATTPEQEPAPEVAKPVEPKPLESKPPASWTPAAREKWASLPPEAQAEIARRERETAVVLQESAKSRQTLGELEKVLAPHMPMFRADNTHPLQAIDSTLRAMAVLRTGTPANKAAMLAKLTQAFDVDVALLDEALAGQPKQPQKPAEYRDPRVDQLMSHLQQAAQQKQHAVVTAATSEVDRFAQGHEHTERVRGMMADLMDAAARNGVELSLEDAYSRACWADPEVRGWMQQSEAASKAQTAQAATAKARNASSSLKSQPAPGASPQTSAASSIEDDVRAAVRRSSR